MNKPRRVRIYKLSTFDTLTERERKLYDLYKAAGKEKATARELFDTEIAKYEGVRKIDCKKLYLYQTNKETDEITEYENTDKQIALFESEMVRYATDFMTEDKCPLLTEIVYMKVAGQMEILNQIIKRGLMIEDDKYIFYSATTNQMKSGEFILVKEDFANQHNKQFMCGLTDEIINNNGGCNTGKYLAYKGLPLSASILPDGYKINIDECLVVPDFQTSVRDIVEYIKHDDTYITEIQKTEMDVIVPHTDGAGMFLPGVLPASAQIRCGHLKGAIFPFDFRKFLALEEVEGVKPCPIIKDAWGNEHDVLEENIKVIFTASQLKMWRYYGSWDEYKQEFKDNHMQIAINKFADTEPKGYVKSSYQFLQTLSSEKLTDEMIEKICKDTLDYLASIKQDVDKVIDILGEDYVADTIRVYPELLQDKYIQSRVEDKFRKERTNARGGKLILKDSLYSYICPDLYAFSTWLFCGIEKPKGLVPKDYVYNSFFNDKDYEKVDCLRSPHLYIEHGIRNLVKGELLEQCKKWFNDLDTVVSNHDLLCRTLMFDVDGDEVLLCPNKDIIECVPQDVVPLYYEAFDAEKSDINTDTIYKALVSSMDNSNIGDISNIMTKNYNNEETDTEFNKVMCCYNNLTIDFPKTQRNIELGDYQNKYEQLKDEKPPYFFRYAKDKKKENCKEISNSNVDRICAYIHKKTGNRQYGWKDAAKKFDPSILFDQDIKVSETDEKYDSLEKLMFDLKDKERYLQRKIKEAAEKVNSSQAEEIKRNKHEVFYHMCERIIIKLFDCGDVIKSRKEATAYLLDFEYLKRENDDKGKNILWNCFGDIIYKNVCRNKGAGNYKKRRQHYKDKSIPLHAIEGEVAKLIKDAPEKSVTIYEQELEWINGKRYRANSPTDRELLYILLVLYKVYDGKVTLSKKKKMLTCSKIDKWIGEAVGADVTVASKGLNRLKKMGVIITDDKKSEVQVTVKVPVLEELEKAFEVGNICKQNPLIPYFKSNEERKIADCEICGKEFIKHGRQITCSEKCSRENELRKKRKRTA